MKNMRILSLFYTAVLAAVVGSGLFTSCVDDSSIPSTYYSSNDLLVGQYLSTRPADLSEFTKILDTTGVLGLLNAYGKYTCFIPNNVAMYNYYLSKGKISRSEFSMEELKKICYNHIIKGDTIATGDFSVGPLSSMSMSERFVNIDFSLIDGSILVNGNCPIIEKDIRVHNGYIHLLSKTLEPSELKLGEKIAQDPKFSLFSEALELTGYAKMMNDAVVEDESYDPKNCTWTVKTYNIKEEIPQHRKFGFTVLMESDSTLANYTECPLCPNGINSIDDLKNLAKYYYSRSYEGNYSDGVGVDDPKDPRNYLNRYVAYHCMNRTLASSRLINDYDTPTQIKTFDMYEFIETMLSNTLIKVKKDRNYTLTFFMNMWDESDINTGVQLTKDIDNDAINGYYHEVDKPLVYSRNVVSNISSNRIRMEASSFFREFATNNMRGNNPTAENVVGKAHRYIIPDGYCEGLKCSATTRFTYLNANGIYEDWQGDEIYVEGTYNFSLVTSPIPAGTYEVRMSYQPTDWRGIAQLYWDSIPCGIPLNLALLANNAEVGWVLPGSDSQDPDGYENDKMMHNRGYMKGAASYKCTIPLYYDITKTARTSIKSLRRVLGTYTFSKAAKHTFTVVGLGSSGGDIQFMLDYLEFVPTELLETEGIE
jgi:uncharacterized surface protein with fasciclin (FAS1) repeats